MTNRRSILLAAFLLIVGAGSGEPLSAQAADEGYIVILDPAEWTGEGVRSVSQPVGRSLRIRGLAYHPSGIISVHVNGHRAVMASSQDSGVVEFTVFLPVTSGTEEAFFVAAAREGSPVIVSRSLDLLPAERLVEDGAVDQRLEGLGTRWAVVIGVSEYEDAAVPNLRYAHRDAEALRDFLVSESAGLGGYDPERVVLLTNEQATFRNIRTALRGFLTSATEDDQIVFYFAGHGVRDPTRPDEYYLLTYDTEFDNLAGTALPMSDVEQALQSLRYRDLVLLADACHSGEIGTQVAFRDAFQYNDINDVFRERFQASRGGEVVFTAGEGRDLSQEGERWGGGHGVFTYHLLRGMEGAADTNGDGLVELGELLEYVREQVRRDTGGAQNPAIAGGSFDRYLPLAVVQPDLVADAEPEPEPDVVADAVADADVRADLPPPVRVETPPVQATDAVAARPAAADEEAEEAQYLPGVTAMGAFGRGMVLPGLGQFHTGRPLTGVLVAGGVATGVGLAVRSGIRTETRTYQAPFGGSYQEDVDILEYPTRSLGVGLAAAALFGGALEAALHASRAGGGGAANGLALHLAPDRSGAPHSAGAVEFGLRWSPYAQGRRAR